MKPKLTVSTIAIALGKSEPVIRSYSRLGSFYLSDGANNTRKKIFNESDTRVLHFISNCRDAGKKDDEIEAMLKQELFRDTEPIDLNRNEAIIFSEQTLEIMALKEEIEQLKAEIFDLQEHKVKAEFFEVEFESLRTRLEEVQNRLLTESRTAYRDGFRDAMKMNQEEDDI